MTVQSQLVSKMIAGPSRFGLGRSLIRTTTSRSLRSRPTIAYRYLSTSSARRATEVPQDPLADPEMQKIYEKIRNHQGAVDAMLAIGKIMQDKGIDTTRPPSTMQMMKLSMDKDMREAGKKLMEEFRNAGIDMSPEVMKALFSKMRS